jgi:hypothetical protein
MLMNLIFGAACVSTFVGALSGMIVVKAPSVRMQLNFYLLILGCCSLLGIVLTCLAGFSSWDRVPLFQTCVLALIVAIFMPLSMEVWYSLLAVRKSFFRSGVCAFGLSLLLAALYGCWDNSRCLVTITNRSGHAIQHGALNFEGSYMAMGTLKNAEQRTKRIYPKSEDVGLEFTFVGMSGPVSRILDVYIEPRGFHGRFIVQADDQVVRE